MSDSYVETASNAAAATAVQTVAGSSVSYAAAATGSSGSSGTVPSSALPFKGAASLSRASSIGLAACAFLVPTLFALVA